MGVASFVDFITVWGKRWLGWWFCGIFNIIWAISIGVGISEVLNAIASFDVALSSAEVLWVDPCHTQFITEFPKRLSNVWFIRVHLSTSTTSDDWESSCGTENENFEAALFNVLNRKSFPLILKENSGWGDVFLGEGEMFGTSDILVEKIWEVVVINTSPDVLLGNSICRLEKIGSGYLLLQSLQSVVFGDAFHVASTLQIFTWAVVKGTPVTDNESIETHNISQMMVESLVVGA